MKLKFIHARPLLRFLLALLLGLEVSCSLCFAQEKIKIVTTLLPYREFIKAVGGELVEVTVFLPPGINPHAAEFAPAQFKDFSRAGLYVKTGAGLEFERVWVEKLFDLARGLQSCDSSAGLDLLQEEGHGEKTEHVHQGQDPHVWLSPRNVKVIIRNIRDALARLDPANREKYARNAEEYDRKLDRLDQEITAKLSGLKNRSFIVFHPAWGYFARDYDLRQIAIEVEGKEPSPRSLARIVRAAREKGIRTVLVSPQVNPKIARVIAEEIQGKVEVADPLAEDYFGNLRRLAALLAGQ